MSNNDSFIKKYPLICLSSLNSEIATFPIDSVKTRMQLLHKPFFNTLKTQVRLNGLSSLYMGIQPAILRHWTYTGMRISLYENTRNKFSSFGYSENDILPKIISSSFAGGISQFIASPTDLLKIRMISNIENKPKLIATIKQIYKTGGIKAFYKGSVPNVLRASSVNIGELASYDIAKKNILLYRNKEDNITFTCASLISGFVSALLSTPFDTAKSRIMDVNNKGMYKGTFDCMKKNVNKHGLKSLYVGFFPNWFRLAPWQFVFWNSYEMYRKSLGMEGF